MHAISAPHDTPSDAGLCSVVGVRHFSKQIYLSSVVMQKPRAPALLVCPSTFRVDPLGPVRCFPKTCHFVLSRLTSKSSANKLLLFPEHVFRAVFGSFAGHNKWYQNQLPHAGIEKPPRPITQL